MNTDAAGLNLAPKIFRFSDIDAFRNSVRTVNVDFTPLVRTIAAEQIILNLPGCDLNHVTSFPRIYDAYISPNATVVGFSMDDGAPIRFNGVERDREVIVIGNGGGVYNSVERTPRQFASIVFTPEIQGRGWPQTGPNFQMFEITAATHESLRRLVRRLLAVSSQSIPGVEVSEIKLAMKESLLAAIDAAFDDMVPARWSSRANSLRQFRVLKDIQAALAGDVGTPVYSGELARQVGVSVRTLHDAVKRFRGMSLHRYLRLRRLWLVRKRLLDGADSVKACALAYGFWHLSDFSRIYRLQFGESPSQTLARSRYA